MALRQIEVSQNDGIVVQNDVDPLRLRKIRIINFIEPIITYGLILLVMWVSELDEDLWWMWASFGILLLWVLLLSPIWHYYGLNEKEIFLLPEQRNFWFWLFECRGLGSLKKFYQRGSDGKRGFQKYWNEIKTMTILWDILAIGALICFNQDYREILLDLINNDSTIVQIGMGIAVLIIADIVVIFIAYPFMMRLDNFASGWKNQLKTLTMLGIPFVFIFNLIFQVFYPSFVEIFGTTGAFGMRGADPFTRLSGFLLFDFLGQWAGYVAWGWLQQLLFLSIFSTQFCRAFDLKKDPKGVYLAALCSAIFFGLIHLPNFWLSILTWTAGFLWAIAFMKCRNLMILGVSHGMLGTLGNKLLPISYNVGPSSI